MNSRSPGRKTGRSIKYTVVDCLMQSQLRSTALLICAFLCLTLVTPLDSASVLSVSSFDEYTDDVCVLDDDFDPEPCISYHLLVQHHIVATVAQSSTRLKLKLPLPKAYLEYARGPPEVS